MPLHGPLKIVGPSRYAPSGITIVAFPCAAHAALHAVSKAYHVHNCYNRKYGDVMMKIQEVSYVSPLSR